MSTFNWSPARGPSQTKQPRVMTAKFGDGYQQRVADGINNMPRTWSLQFTRLTADVDAIEAFLVARGGVESFDWTPPFGNPGKWICPSWSRAVPDLRLMDLSATFEEVFGE